MRVADRVKLFALSAGLLAVLAPASASPVVPPRAETVVLLHGLGRTGWSLHPLATALEKAGFQVIYPSYPWRTRTLEELAREWLPAQLGALRDVPRIHLVTHSMGGILVRLWLRDSGAPANLGRVVMIAPPNGGSEIPDQLADFAPFRWIVGPNGPRLGTAADALPAMLGPWPAPAIDLGIIAGRTSGVALPGVRVAAPHDGKVSIASTHLAGMRDHMVLPFSHAWITWRGETAAQVTHFLREGRFIKPP